MFVLLSKIVTARKRSCGKVMFLCMSVSHAVHRGWEGACVAEGRGHAFWGIRGMHGSGGSHAWQRGMHGGGRV